MAINTFVDTDKLRRDQLILGASRFMSSGEDFSACGGKASTFTRVERCSEYPEGWKPAEGDGDTVIPINQRFFDGSIPPGISTDPTKPVVDAMPDTPLQRVRKATVKLLTAGLELNEALEALDRYQTLTGKP